MIIKAYEEKHKYLLFIDLEFSGRHLVQFAGLLFRRIEDDDNIYQLARSYNVYITQKVCYPFVEYTSITNNFLNENGVPLADAIAYIQEEFLGDDVDKDDLMIITHGLKNDRLILKENGLQLVKSNGSLVDGFCTYNAARRILRRENHLSLEDLCNECGYYLHHAHNAYNDVWAEVAIYTYLKKIEKQHEVEEA